MTQWSPVKGANLLVDPRAQQRKERREKRYPPPPVPPVEPPPMYDFSKRFRKPHATRGGADFGRSSVRASVPDARGDGVLWNSSVTASPRAGAQKLL